MKHLSLSTAMASSLVLLCSTGCAGQESGVGPDRAPADLTTTLEAAIVDWAASQNHRGVSAAVIFADGDTWVGAAGSEAAGSDLEPAHLMWIASITKTMTGAIILQLAEEQRLGLDDRISRWLDPMTNVDGDVTIRQLLNHTNGLANYTSSVTLNNAIGTDASRVFTAAELLGFVEPPEFSPGERTRYTNTAFVLLGLVAESVTGTPITDLYRTRLWEPLGMEEIFLPGFQQPAGPVASTWAGNPPTREIKPLEHMSLLSIGNSAFGLFSNARTVAAWGRELFTGSVISDEMHRQMIEFVPAAGNIPGEAGAGLGIRSYGYLGREQWGHSGGSALGSSLLLYDPATGITVAVVMNQGRSSDHFTLAPRLLEIAAGG